MFEGLLQPLHLLLIVGIALLCFGPRKFADLGRGSGMALETSSQP
jgi:sec-independent protein translocase protein TatA